MNIYAPNDANQQITFFKELENQLKTLPKRILLSQVTLTALCLKMTKKVETHFGKKSTALKELQHLANLYNLTDIWRDRNPNDSRFTWRNKSPKIQCRLDFFLISKELSNDTDACNIINAPESDHCAVTLHTMASRL